MKGGCKWLLKAVEEGNIFLPVEQGIAKEVRDMMLKVVRKTQEKRGDIRMRGGRVRSKKDWEEGKEK